MATDQRRKQPNGANIADVSSWDHNRSKKKKTESTGKDLHSKSHVSLEWNGHQKKVVAKKEQIAMSWRNLRPFIDSIPHSRNSLADVFSIPPEVFQLENLTDVISHEAWQTLLSDNEQDYLMQFLSKGQDAEQIVHALVNGENFHFGSPLLEWGVSLCSGDLHPDAVLRHERGLKAERKVYYSEIQNYHHGMIESLQKLKERCEGSQNYEQEILQKASSKPRKQTETSVAKHIKRSKVREVEQDITSTSESSSWMADGRACSSDNQNSPMMKGGGLVKRMGENCSVKEKGRKLMTFPDNVPEKTKPVAKLPRSSVDHHDGSKYMSYIKVTKSQYEQVKTTKQFGKSIQSRSLNRVLGDPDDLYVQPYEVFLKEEHKKLHDHWLQLAKDDLPAAYENWRARQIQRREMIKSLEQDMRDHLNHVECEEKENLDRRLQDSHRQSETHSNSSMGVEEESDAENEEKESPDNMLQDHIDSETESECDTEDDEDPDVRREAGNVENVFQTKSEPCSEDEEEEVAHNAGDTQNDGAGDTQNDEEDAQNNEQENPENMILHYQGSSAANFESPHVHQIASLDSSLEFNMVEMEPDKNHVYSKTDCIPPYASGYMNHAGVGVSHGIGTSHSSGTSQSSGNMNPAGVAVSQHILWPTVGMPHHYHETTARHEYTAVSGLSHALTTIHGVEKQCNPMVINLETDLHDEAGKTLISRQTNHSSFNSYTNQDRSELFQSFFKNQQVSSYNQEQKRPDLDFQPPNNVTMQDRHYNEHFPEPPLAMEQGQKRPSDIFLPQNMLENIYAADQGRFLLPRQEHFPSNNVPEWNTNPPHISSSLQQPPLNGGEIFSQNWFPGGAHQLRGGGWNGSKTVNIPTQMIGSGNNADLGLYSVLSQCNQLRPRYDSMGRSEELVSSRNYGLIGPGAYVIGSNLPQASNPLDYLGGRDPPASLIPEEMGWTNLQQQHQNPAVHDPVGKPFWRS